MTAAEDLTATRTCFACQEPTDQPWQAWCMDCWMGYADQLPAPPRSRTLAGAGWQHPVYGLVSERLEVADVLDQLAERVTAGKAPSLSKAAAVALLDHLRPEHAPPPPDDGPVDLDRYQLDAEHAAHRLRFRAVRALSQSDALMALGSLLLMDLLRGHPDLFGRVTVADVLAHLGRTTERAQHMDDLVVGLFWTAEELDRMEDEAARLHDLWIDEGARAGAAAVDAAEAEDGGA